MYKTYKQMFIIRDDYSDQDDFDDNRSIIVDETNLNYYDSDNYTTITEDLCNNSDSDLSVDDAHSTTSEPFLASHSRKLTHSQSVGGITNTDSPLSLQLGFPSKKSVSNGAHPLIQSIPEHKSMMASLPTTPRKSNKDGNESDGTGK